MADTIFLSICCEISGCFAPSIFVFRVVSEGRKSIQDCFARDSAINISGQLPRATWSTCTSTSASSLSSLFSNEIGITSLDPLVFFQFFFFHTLRWVLMMDSSRGELVHSLTCWYPETFACSRAARQAWISTVLMVSFERLVSNRDFDIGVTESTLNTALVPPALLSFSLCCNKMFLKM